MTPQPTYRGQWVSVKERLPNKMGAYKCYSRYGITLSAFVNNTFSPDVTHWLELYPLPPVPKELIYD